jgi:hypothetical protein
MLQLTDNEFDDWLIAMELLHGSQTCDHCSNQMSSAHFSKNTHLYFFVNGKIPNFDHFLYIYYPESESEKHFQGSEMCAIDFLHKVTPREVTHQRKKAKKFTLIVSSLILSSTNFLNGNIFYKSKFNQQNTW